jgi:hypothetical protein
MNGRDGEHARLVRLDRGVEFSHAHNHTDAGCQMPDAGLNFSEAQAVSCARAAPASVIRRLLLRARP